jgi:hypothetical protein
MAAAPLRSRIGSPTDTSGPRIPFAMYLATPGRHTVRATIPEASAGVFGVETAILGIDNR